MVILDTNIVIDHLRSKKESFLEKLSTTVKAKDLTVSVISIQELYAEESTRDGENEKFLLATIAPLKILPYTYEVAKLAGEIARDLKEPIELADAAIAATAILNSASLFTLNKKDFQKIPQLKFYKL